MKMSESEQNECRICFESSRQESMVSPCDCCGSMKFVHKHCLLMWINTSHRLKCQVCGIQLRCQLTVKRPNLWTFIPQNFVHFLGDILVVLHICFIMICTQLLGAHVLMIVFRHKCLSIDLSDKLLDLFCKVLVSNVMITSTVLNTYCFIICLSELKTSFTDRWNQFFEYSFSE